MVFIYFVQENEKYLPLLNPFFSQLAASRTIAITSYVTLIVTLIEVLVQPLSKGQEKIAGQYRDILLNAENLELFPVDRKIAETAAEIRSSYKCRTPDAIQLATAINHGADVFITNDAMLKRYDKITVVVLDDLLPAGKSQLD